FDCDAAESHSTIVAQRLVMITGNKHELGAFARLAQELLQHVVVRLWPVDAAPDAPEVDDVADKVDAVCVVAAQEVEEGFGLTGLRAQMQVRDEKCAVTPHAGLMLHVFVSRFQHDVPGLKVILYQACDIYGRS